MPDEKLSSKLRRFRRWLDNRRLTFESLSGTADHDLRTVLGQFDAANLIEAAEALEAGQVPMPCLGPASEKAFVGALRQAAKGEPLGCMWAVPLDELADSIEKYIAAKDA